jgi:hypothetical protein
MNELPQRHSSGISPRPYLFGLRPRPTRISTTTTTTVASPPPMMARLLAQTLTLTRPGPSPSSASLWGLATKVEVIEIDLTEDDPVGSSSSPTASPSVDVVVIRCLEEAIHGVMVRRATPDWLPFVPCGSFWVPPLRRPHGVAEIFSRIAAAAGAEGLIGATDAAVGVVEIDAPMTEEEALSFSTARGWPSASYFVDGEIRPRSDPWNFAILFLLSVCDWGPCLFEIVYEWIRGSAFRICFYSCCQHNSAIILKHLHPVPLVHMYY